MAEPPVGCRITLSESSDQRLVFAIPAGGPKTRSLGTIAIVWNLFIFGSAAFVFVMSLEMALVLLFVPFMTLFMLVGVYLAGSWFSMKFTRTNLLVTRESLSVQKVLLSHKRLTTTELDGNSDARLCESYSQDDEPIFRVQVDGVQTTARFGTALSRSDKDWLVESINGFLGQETQPPMVSGRDIPDAEQPFAELAPAHLPAESLVQVQATPEKMTIITRTAPRGPVLFGLIAMLTFAVTLWLGVGLWRLALAGTINNVLGWLFVAISALPISAAMVLLFGRTTVTIDGRTFVIRLHLGPLGWSFRRPSQLAERVSLTATSGDPSEDTLATTIVQISSSKLLACWGSMTTCREVAGLVGHQFRTLDIETNRDAPE